MRYLCRKLYMKGVISAGDRLTAKAGAEILRMGGNAFDSACGAILASTLSEPMLTSLGGGGFMLTHQEGKKPILYDFFVDVVPNREKNPNFFPIYVDFGSTIQEFHIGTASIATSGVVAGIYQINREKGKLPLKEIIQPALKYAKEGIYLSKTQAYFVKLLEPILSSTKNSKEVFFKDDELIDNTHLYRNPDFANFLESFAIEGSDLFYKGEIAKEIEKLSIENEGNIRKEDLEKYQVIKRKPINFEFKNYQIFTNPPPSAGGILIAFTLKLLEELDLKEFGSFEHLKNLIEALFITNDFRKEHINEYLHRSGLEEILKDEKLLNSFLLSKKSRLNLWGNTTHISVIDREGNSASVTTTNGEGSGYIIPNTGIMLNNMLGEEDLNPHGFFKWPPYVRLPSMMSPTILLKDNKVKLILGSSGSNRIRSALVQSILNYLLFNKSAKEATELQRIHIENNTLFYENGFNEEIFKKAKKLYKFSKFNEKNMFFGGVNIVTGDFDGGSDPRRGGVVEFV